MVRKECKRKRWKKMEEQESIKEERAKKERDGKRGGIMFVCI